MATKIKTDELAAAVDEILSGYAENVVGVVKEEAQDVAKTCVKEIKANARALFRTSGSNSYANSWRQKVTAETPEGVVVTVYSRKYHLAHLLEHGHAIVRSGKMIGRVRARPHIAPAEQNAAKELEKRIKIKVSGGAE